MADSVVQDFKTTWPRVVDKADGSHVPVVALDGTTAAGGGGGYSYQYTLTRTNDTNAYTAGDVLGSATSAAGAVLAFTGMGPAAGHIIITDVDFLVAVTAVPSGMTSFRLHLYNAIPTSALGDNAAWDLPSTDRTQYLGYIDLGTPADVGSSLFVQTSQVNKKVLMGATSTLYGYLVTNGGYTPTAQAVKYIRLNAVGC